MSCSKASIMDKQNQEKGRQSKTRVSPWIVKAYEQCGKEEFPERIKNHSFLYTLEKEGNLTHLCTCQSDSSA